MIIIEIFTGYGVLLRPLPADMVNKWKTEKPFVYKVIAW